MTKSDQRSRLRRVRTTTVIAIGIVVMLGLGCKAYEGPGQDWVNNFGPASICYEVFFVLLVFLVVPQRAASAMIATIVCVATCGLEFSQLCQAAWLQSARETFVGRTLLGTSFSWWDFPAYPVGAWCGWMLVRTITNDDEADTS